MSSSSPGWSGPTCPWLGVWAYTIAAASLVNVLAGSKAQRFVAGALLSGALVGLPLSEPPAPLLVVYGLFVLKVAYAFAVDHGASGAQLDPDGIRVLTHRDRSGFVALIGAAFADDPLFVAVLGSGNGPRTLARREALVGYLFDMNRTVGGQGRGLFADGRLVGAMLLEPPARGGLRTVLRLVGASARYLPVGLRLARQASSLLNAYFRRTREVAPERPHHYLAMVGVRPDHQGRGFGHRLIDDAILQARRDPVSTDSPSTPRTPPMWPSTSAGASTKPLS